jgi:hypothetical protein
MTDPELKKALQDILPQLITEDPQVRDFVLRTVSNYYAGKPETESRFDRIMAELQRDREEQARKWDEQAQERERDREEQARKWDDNTRKWDEQAQERARDREEQARKWDDNTCKWDEQAQERARDREEQARKWDDNTRQWEANNRKWEENARQWHEQHQQNMAVLEELKRQDRRYESTIGALGSRWGLYSEASFRNALKGILEDSFGVQVLNVTDFDEAGEVFGRPDQVELDLIISNGTVIICEIKSSLSKSDMYSFNRKVAFYQKRHDRSVSRKLVISPMVDDRARPVAEALGIEVYSYAEAVPNL